MDAQISRYRAIITDLLTEYANAPSVGVSGEEVEEQLILDPVRDHYQILALGWEQGQRVYYPVFHLDIRDGKIWVQEDATDFDLVGELERRGVPRADIVLGFQAPYKRALSGYAVA